jgi:hypothetical protein
MHKRREVKFVVMVLIVMMPLSLWAQAEKPVEKDYKDGFHYGQLDGAKVNQDKWILTGFGGGCLGGGAVWFLAGQHGDKPKHVPEGTSEFQRGYIVGYWEATKSKKQRNALVGGVIGSVLMAGIITVVALTIDWEEGFYIPM